MIRYKLFFLLLCLIISTKCKAEEQNVKDKSVADNKPPDKSIVKKSTQLSKKSGWIAPFKNSSHKTQDIDQIPSADEFGGYHYLPPPSSISDHDRDCSPCNFEPWVPIVGHNKYNYIPHNQFSSLFPNEHSLNNIFSNNGYSGLYGTPPKMAYGVTKPLYGQPKPEYGPPKPEYGPPKPEYGPPKPIYGPPKPIYGPPKPIYGPPKPIYGPPQPEYGPPKPEYGPPKPEYGPPNPNIQTSGGIFIPDFMLPPPLHYKIPSLLYGPPKPIYTTPSKQPDNFYVPPINSNYDPIPRPNYGPPPKPDYGSPKPNYGLPKPQYGPPNTDFNPPNVIYGPPKPIYNQPPKPEYGLPPSIFNPPPPSNQYGPPLIPNIPNNPIYGPPKPEYGVPNLPPPPSSTTLLQRVPESFPNIQENIGQDFVPPPVTSRANAEPLTGVGNSPPVLDNSSPSFDIEGTQHLSNIPLDNGFIPPPVPSDSYGNPVTHDNFDGNQQFDSLPAPSGDNDEPIQNFGSNIQFNSQNSQNRGNILQSNNLQTTGFQALPIYDFKDFHSSANDHSVQVQKSVRVADYVASVEHPINIIQSPLVELQVKEAPEPILNYNRNAKTHYHDFKDVLNNIETLKLSENPIVVEDNHVAATANINNTTKLYNQKRNNDKHLVSPTTGHVNEITSTNTAQNEADLIRQLLVDQGILNNSVNNIINIHKVAQNASFKPPPMEYSDWVPKYYPPKKLHSTIPTSWVSSTQKPIQIIVPYTNKSPNTFSKQGEKGYTTLIPMYMPPMPTESSDWSKYLTEQTTKLNRVTGTPFTKTSTSVYNIKDLISGNIQRNPISEKLPYDIISLQKNIDDWTHQSFSKGNRDQIVPPKQIPDNFFTSKSVPETTTFSNEIFDHHLAESSRKETAVDADIETNFIVAAETNPEEGTTTPLSTTTESQNSSWKSAFVTVSPYTKEKVYVVTPQAYSFVTASPAKAWSLSPKIQNGTTNVTLESQKFSIRIEPEDKQLREKMVKDLKQAVKVVYSEWPHLINNLQTTTPKPTSSHPLFGLMGLTEYTPPPNATVETFVGHSRVTSVVTPSSRDPTLHLTTPKTVTTSDHG